MSPPRALSPMGNPSPPSPFPRDYPRVSLQDGRCHHAFPGQETSSGALQWVSLGVSHPGGGVTVRGPPLISPPPGSGIPGKSCGTIIVLAEELGNCRVRVSAGDSGDGGDTPILGGAEPP